MAKTLERKVVVEGSERHFEVVVPESVGEAAEAWGNEILLDLAVSKYLANTNNVVKGCAEGTDYQDAVDQYKPGQRRTDGTSLAAIHKQLAELKKTNPAAYAAIAASIPDLNTEVEDPGEM